jgi:carboxyl-terminal processing protease
MIGPLVAALLLLPAQNVPSTPGRTLVDTVRDNFLDADAARAWADRHADLANPALDRADYLARARAALAELQTSHTGLSTPDDPEYHALRAIFREALELPPGAVAVETLGLDTTPDGVIRHIFSGGPAAATGLRRGDRILRVEGEPYHPVASARGRAGRPLRVEFEPAGQGPPLTIEITPVAIDPRSLWLDDIHLGTRHLATPGGRTVLYVPYFCGAGEPFTEALRDELAEPRAAEADALLLDARGGWGGSPPDLVSLFDPAVPTMTTRNRDGAEATVQPTWTKPLVVLVDGGTRSGKEILAHAVKRSGRGRLVGARTAGAVVGGSPFPLPDGTLLFLAVVDVRVDGLRLEGAGVEPDVAVPTEPLLGDSQDRQLRAALREADALIVSPPPAR